MWLGSLRMWPWNHPRAQAMAQDPKQQAIKLFAQVWGTGEATAEKWYTDGCRTLEDVGARTDLTKQQVGAVAC